VVLVLQSFEGVSSATGVCTAGLIASIETAVFGTGVRLITDFLAAAGLTTTAFGAAVLAMIDLVAGERLAGAFTVCVEAGFVTGFAAA